MKQLEELRTSLGPSLKKPKVWAPLLLAAFLAICLLYWFVLRTPKSIQAFVNTSVIVMRAPVAGKLTLASNIQVGNSLRRGEPFGVIAADIENPRMSQLRIQKQELVARESNLEEQIAGMSSQLQEKQQQFKQYELESKNQKQLQVKYGEALLNTAKQEYMRSSVSADIADKDVARARQLQARGFISVSALEKAEAARQQAAAAVGVQKAHVAQSELVLLAYAASLQLEGSRTLSQPDSRMRELRTDLVELTQQSKNLVRNLASTRGENARVSEELGSLSNVTLAAPKSGVVWSIAAQPGENVSTNGEVLQMVSCDNVWVEAFFDEADTVKMEVDRAVRIRALHGGKTWNGRIETIRSGAGRVNVGQYIVDPPPEIAHRQLPVRVSTVRVRVDWNGALKPELFCLAGSSVQVLLD